MLKKNNFALTDISWLGFLLLTLNGLVLGQNLIVRPGEVGTQPCSGFKPVILLDLSGWQNGTTQAFMIQTSDSSGSNAQWSNEEACNVPVGSNGTADSYVVYMQKTVVSGKYIRVTGSNGAVITPEPVEVYCEDGNGRLRGGTSVGGGEIINVTGTGVPPSSRSCPLNSTIQGAIMLRAARSTKTVSYTFTSSNPMLLKQSPPIQQSYTRVFSPGETKKDLQPTKWRLAVPGVSYARESVTIRATVQETGKTVSTKVWLTCGQRGTPQPANSNQSQATKRKSGK